MFRASLEQTGGACVAATSWNEHRTASELIVSALPAGQMEVIAVRPNALMDDRDRFNGSAAARGPAIFSKRGSDAASSRRAGRT